MVYHKWHLSWGYIHEYPLFVFNIPICVLMCLLLSHKRSSFLTFRLLTLLFQSRLFAWFVLFALSSFCLVFLQITSEKILTYVLKKVLIIYRCNILRWFQSFSSCYLKLVSCLNIYISLLIKHPTPILFDNIHVIPPLIFTKLFVRNYANSEEPLWHVRIVDLFVNKNICIILIYFMITSNNSHTVAQ